MKINSIYEGIEGEGKHIGTPTTFIRTQGCKVGCRNCDTLESWDENKGKSMSVGEIVEELYSHSPEVISITGGNPLEQDIALVPLIHEINRTFITSEINIEVTGQDYNERVFDLVDRISLDLKTPSTGVKANKENITHILKRYKDKVQLKCVCADNEDLIFIINTYTELNSSYVLDDYQMIITPCYTQKATKFDFDFIKEINDSILTIGYKIRVILQQHKVIYDSKEQNV